MKTKKRSISSYTFLLLGLLALILLAFTFAKGETLWKIGTWKSMAMQFPEFGVFALGVMLAFVAGCIDVSFVALGDFASILGVMYILGAVDRGVPEEQMGGVIIVGIIIALGAGAIGGLINGNLISRLGIPPILATLSTQMLFKGLAIALTKGYAMTGIPEIYGEVGHTYIFGFLPVPMLIFIIVAVIVGFLLKYTTYGKKLYMIGSNPKAARFSAINVTRMINTTFVINGIIAAVAALLMVNTMNSAKADYGTMYIMRCILILVLAGVLPDGGMGKVVNVIIAIVTMQIIATSVNMFPDLNSYYLSLISSIMLLVILMATSRLLGDNSILGRRKRKKELEEETE